jgi:Protein of unknown function (DUF2752)
MPSEIEQEQQFVHRAPTSRLPLQAQTGQYWGRTALLFAACATYATVIFGSLIRCPMAFVFHIPCPTCGGTRAAVGLFRWLSPSPSQSHRAAEPYNWFALPLMFCAIWFFAVAHLHVFQTGSLRGVEYRKWASPVPKVMIVLYSGACVLWLLRFAGFFGGPIPVD